MSFQSLSNLNKKQQHYGAVPVVFTCIVFQSCSCTPGLIMAEADDWLMDARQSGPKGASIIWWILIENRWKIDVCFWNHCNITILFFYNKIWNIWKEISKKWRWDMFFSGSQTWQSVSSSGSSLFWPGCCLHTKCLSCPTVLNTWLDKQSKSEGTSLPFLVVTPVQAYNCPYVSLQYPLCTLLVI